MTGLDDKKGKDGIKRKCPDIAIEFTVVYLTIEKDIPIILLHKRFLETF